MANTSANVIAGKPLATGGIWGAPIGTALPTTESTTLNAAFKSFGYIGEDGVTENQDRSTEKVKAWGGATVKVLQTDFSLTYEFSFIESGNPDVLKAVFGDGNVNVTAATSTKGTLTAIKKNADVLPNKSFVLEMKDGNAKIRIVIPNGQITEVGEVTYNDGEPISYAVTVECFEDATGVQAYQYGDNGQTTSA